MANTIFLYSCETQRNSLIINGVPGGIRTPNLLIRSQKLYPVELQAQIRDETTRNRISPAQKVATHVGAAIVSHPALIFEFPTDHSSSSLLDFCARRAASIGTPAEKHGSWGVANGTRTRNSQNHNLGLYH